jgi:pyrroloquinoline quinone biosynthesis protein D
MSIFDVNCRPTLVAHARMHVDPVSGEPVLLFPEGMMVLNETARDIVLHCDGHATLQEIIVALGEEYEVDEQTLRSDALECLTQLRERNLLVMNP